MELEVRAKVSAQAAGMVPVENAGRVSAEVGGRGGDEDPRNGEPRETNGACAVGGGKRAGEEWRVAEANRRLRVLEAWEAAVAGGMGKAAAAALAGEDYVSVWRWRKAYEAMGYAGLVPGTGRCGRKTVFERLGLTREEVESVVAEVRGLNLDMQSVTAALRLYARSDRCPAGLAEVILDGRRRSKHDLPPSLRAAARVNGNLRKAHEGRRALALRGIWTPRKLDILPGDIFTSDDTTPIWAWWVPWRASEEHPHGVKLLQGQFLPMLDVASQCVLTYVLVAREAGSYRAADIWHLFGHTFEVVGLPRLGFQLERGSWESNLIRGVEVSWREGEATHSRRVGGLRQLPTNVTRWHRERHGEDFAFPRTLQTWTSYLPKSKSVEAFFNRSQSLEGTLWGCLGRDQRRRPYEKAKKLYEACRRGAADPREHFLSYDELVRRLNGMLEYLNGEPLEGEVFRGAPARVWEQAVGEYPLYRVAPAMQWLYRRDWAVVRITQGWARVRLTDGASGARYSLFYSNPEVFAAHEGDAVCVYYDREEFERPAQVILGRTGEYLCEAAYEERRGSFLSGDLSGHDVRKRWREAVLAAYGTVVKHAPSRQVPEEVAARRAMAGGRGELVVVDRRPAAGPEAAGARGEAVRPPGPEEWRRRGERLARQAEIAARLNALAGQGEGA